MFSMPLVVVCVCVGGGGDYSRERVTQKGKCRFVSHSMKLRSNLNSLFRTTNANRKVDVLRYREVTAPSGRR